MKIVVSVIIYNRFANLQKWLECWDKSDTTNAELRIIHNVDGKINPAVYKAECDKVGVTYLQRPNIGYDIGALQDVCMERLPGFDYEYDYMLWCTDDTIPMRRTFISEYMDLRMTERVVCLEISNESVRHIRTTGILANRATWRSFKFIVDVHQTLTHNYAFEHRGGESTMLRQIESWGISYSQPWELSKAPMWDIDKRESLGRWDEWHKNFSDDAEVLFISTIHNRFPQIVSSLICQTHKNWRLLLIHDGLNHTKLREYIEAIGDDRIQYLEMPDRTGRWGHPWRQWALERLRAGDYPDAKYVVITNDDNYYVPVFCEYMLKGFKENTVATYCDQMVHSYIQWQIIKCDLQRGKIDCGGVMVRRMVAQEIGWRDIESHSSDWVYFEDIIKQYGAQNWAKVAGCLFSHN
jgi:hypothetical protein